MYIDRRLLTAALAASAQGVERTADDYDGSSTDLIGHGAPYHASPDLATYHREVHQEDRRHPRHHHRNSDNHIDDNIGNDYQRMTATWNEPLPLEAVYEPALIAAQQSRFAALRARFVQEFPEHAATGPAFFARAPGRVNLIGEHIDYSDFSVLPMALTDKDMVIACAPNRAAPSGKVLLRVANSNSDKFPTREFQWDVRSDGGSSSSSMIKIDIDATKHEWSNYFLSGFKGVLTAMQERGQLHGAPVSMDCLVDGSVPTGAGVSSSAAFVSCTALATMKANGGTLTKKELTEVAIVSERFVGVQSGGMDQAASIFGMPSSALLIDFKPTLHVTPVQIPSTTPPPVFVIAHTLVTANKHVTAPIHYNLRVVETRMASALLAKTLLGLQPDGQMVLRGVMERCVKEGVLAVRGDVGRDEGAMVEALQGMLALVERTLKKDGYTRDDVAEALDMSLADVHELFLSKITVRADTFQLYRRTMHVFSEALRVYRFKRLCANVEQPPAGSSGGLLGALGGLMDESQASCAAMFECSCPELDELTGLARKSGALGSRLTGAGWGGCSVSLVPEPQVPAFIKAIKEGYYAKLPQAANLNLDEYIFASKPGLGATLIATKGTGDH